MQGEKHQNDVEGIGVDDGRRVECQSAFEETKQMIGRQSVGKMPKIDQQISHTGNEIDQIGQQEVPDECRNWCERGVEYAEFPSLFVSHHSVLF